MEKVWEFLHLSYRQLRKVFIFVIGATVILFGVVLIFLPGPAIVVIPAGLAILAIEFKFARKWLDSFKRFVNEKTGRNKGGVSSVSTQSHE